MIDFTQNDIDSILGDNLKFKLQFKNIDIVFINETILVINKSDNKLKTYNSKKFVTIYKQLPLNNEEIIKLEQEVFKYVI